MDQPIDQITKAIRWKEWRELAFPWTGLMAVEVFLMVGEVLQWEAAYRYNFLTIALVVAGVAAILFGGDTFAGERSRGTLDYLESLPLSRREIWKEKAKTRGRAYLIPLTVAIVFVLVLQIQWLLRQDLPRTVIDPLIEIEILRTLWVGACLVFLFFASLAFSAVEKKTISAGGLALVTLVGGNALVLYLIRFVAKENNFSPMRTVFLVGMTVLMLVSSGLLYHRAQKWYISRVVVEG